MFRVFVVVPSGGFVWFDVLDDKELFDTKNAFGSGMVYFYEIPQYAQEEIENYVS